MDPVLKGKLETILNAAGNYFEKSCMAVLDDDVDAAEGGLANCAQAIENALGLVRDEKKKTAAAG